MWEITVSSGRRNPATGNYGQVSRTVHTSPWRPGAKGNPKMVEAEVAKLMAEVDGGRHHGERHTLGELLDEYLRHQEARGRAPKTLLEVRRRVERITSDPIGGKDLRRLTGRDLDEFYARLSCAQQAWAPASPKGGGVVEVIHVDKLVSASRWKSGPGSCQEAR